MIRNTIILLISSFLLSCSANSNIDSEVQPKLDTSSKSDIESKLENGDIIFQVSLTPQSKAVKLATKSQYSHVGIIFKDEDSWMVYEAIQPVTKTPLKEWIERGENGHYVLKRLKNSKKVLNSEVIEKMKAIGEENMGKDYDIYFNWSDVEMYCSELVWKIYDQAADIRIGELKQLKDLDLTSESVQTILSERYGTAIPLEGKIIAPSGLFDSDKLRVVDQN